MRMNSLVLSKIEKLCFALICVLMADCCLFGAGRLVEFGPVGFRLALFAVVMVVSVPILLKNWKKLLQNRFIQLLIVFFIWLVFEAARGVLRGNNLSILASDLRGFAYLVFLPVVLCVVNTTDRLNILSKVIMYTSGVLGLFAMVSVAVFLWVPDLFALFLHLTPTKGTTVGVVAYTAITSKLLRVFFYSGLYLLCGCTLSIYHQIKATGKVRFRYCLVTGVCLLALLLTYTRSVYFAAFVAAVALVAMFVIKGDKESRARLGKHLLASVAVFAVVLMVFSMAAGTNYLGYGFSRVGVTFGSADFEEATDVTDESDHEQPDDADETDDESKYNNITAESDELRAKTVEEMLNNIRQSPIIGLGLGLALKIRKTGYSEYFYLDMLSKTGIIGLLLYVAPMLYMVFKLLKNRKLGKSQVDLAWALVSALLGFFAYSYFNPYMNAALGILMYCCTIGAFQVTTEQTAK